MSGGENKTAETNEVFSLKKSEVEIREKDSIKIERESVEIEVRTSFEGKQMFGRLKKSLRKKSANIL